MSLFRCDARSFISVFTLIVVFATTTSAVPVDRYWNELQDEDFVVGANWLGGVAPDADDTAIFDLGRTEVNKGNVFFVYNNNVVETKNLDIRNDYVIF